MMMVVVLVVQPVRVAVRLLLRGGRPDRHHLDVEVERLTRQRVVVVDGHAVVVDADHPQRDLLAVGPTGDDLHPLLDIGVVREPLPRNGLRLGPTALAVRVGRRDHGVELVSDLLAFELPLEPGHDVAGALEVCERLAIVGAVQELAPSIPEDVVDGDDHAVADGWTHETSPPHEGPPVHSTPAVTGVATGPHARAAGWPSHRSRVTEPPAGTFTVVMHFPA